MTTLKELSDLGLVLNVKTANLNDALHKAEALLIALVEKGAGCTAHVPLWAEGPEHLAFKKHDDKWGLYIMIPGGTVRLANAPRAQRIAATTRLPDLLKALQNAVKSEITNVDAAVTTMAGFLARLEKT